MKWNKDRYENDVWCADGMPERVSVHHYIGFGDEWFVSCHRLGIDKVRLASSVLPEALKKAEQHVRDVVGCWVTALMGDE